MIRCLILTAGLLVGMLCRPAVANQVGSRASLTKHPVASGDYSLLDGRWGNWPSSDSSGKPAPFNITFRATSDVHQKLIFQADRFAVEVLVGEPEWRLTLGDVYTIALKVGSNTRVLTMETNSATTLLAATGPADLVTLFGKIDKASHIDLVQGGSYRRTISLAGAPKLC